MKEQEQPDSAQLAGFLHYLSGHHPDTAMRKMVKRLATEIGKVAFRLDDKRFQNYCFCPLGIPGAPNCDLFEHSRHEITVISPFLSKSRINMLKHRLLTNGHMVLISRKDELDKLPPGTLTGIDCWHMKDGVVDGEDALDENGLTAARQDIHAKLYLTTRDSWSQLWVGSANCSEKGFAGNIEFLLRLGGYRRYCNQSLLCDDFFGDDERENPFTQYTPPSQPLTPENTDDDRVLELLTRAICRCAKTAQASVALCDVTKQLYAVEVDLPALPAIPEDLAVTIHPLCHPNAQKPLQEKLRFSEILLEDLNMFYVLKLVRRGMPDDVLRSFVLTIPTMGIPETRDGAIYRSVIGTPDEFFAYIALLLGEDYAVTLAEQHLGQTRLLGSHQVRGGKPVVFEKMMRAASRRPEALEEIREIISLCASEDANIIPDDFKALYTTFESVIKAKRRKR
jgi:hypothetical protein